MSSNDTELLSLYRALDVGIQRDIDNIEIHKNHTMTCPHKKFLAKVSTDSREKFLAGGMFVDTCEESLEMFSRSTCRQNGNNCLTFNVLYADGQSPVYTMYHGGFGGGHYHRVQYNVQTNEYTYALGEYQSEWKNVYTASVWNDMYRYITNYAEKITGKIE
jgi:hypothetical protein